MQDVLWGLETGKLSEGEFLFAIDLSQLRFFYPQLWLQATLDKENILRQYLAKDFTEFDSRPVPSAYVFSRMFLPAMGNVGNKFYSLTACWPCRHSCVRKNIAANTANIPRHFRTCQLTPSRASPCCTAMELRMSQN